MILREYFFDENLLDEKKANYGSLLSGKAMLIPSCVSSGTTCNRTTTRDTRDP